MKIIQSVLIIILCVSSLYGQSKKVQIEQILDDYLVSNSPGLAVMATQGDQVLYKNAFGLSNLEHSKPIHPDQVFRIGSVTKQFTATAILLLAHEGQLDLGDAIEKYIPEAIAKKEITIRQLLNHTSGLGNQSDIPSFEEDVIDGNYPKIKMEQIMKMPLKFPAGTKYAYSNLGYITLGYIIEQVSGMTYESYLAKHFFQPLQMKNTGFEHLQDYTSSKSQGYSYTGETYRRAEDLNMEIPYAAGGLVSNLEDLVLWNRAVMSGKLIPMQYVQQLAKANNLPNGQATEYSMGWRVGQIQGVKSVKHDGIINGYTSMTIYLPESDIFVAVLSNCDQYRDIEIPTSKIAAVLLGKPYISKAIPVSKPTLVAYQGRFQSEGDTMNVVLHDDQLMFYKRGNNKSKMIPIAPGQFLLEGSLQQITFGSNKVDKGFTLSSLSDSKKWTMIKPLKAYTALSLDDKTLNEFIGRYQIKDQFVFEILKIDDKMYGQVGNDRKEILCFDTDTFCVLDMDAIIRFSRDTDGKVAQINVKQIGEFSGIKMD